MKKKPSNVGVLHQSYYCLLTIPGQVDNTRTSGYSMICWRRQQRSGDEKSNDNITHKHIENMQKIFHTHRAALNFDKGFIVTLLKSGKDFDFKQEVEIGPGKKNREWKKQK
jgi:hypothetical protein